MAGSQLTTQLDIAATNNILMFCSSSDNGLFSSSNRRFYPHISEKCIKIGAATRDGYGCSWVDENVDYYLPGKDIPFYWQSSEEMGPQDGSSLATALAAGLAGILKYAYRAYNNAETPELAEEEDEEERNIFHGRDPKLRSIMVDIFKQLTNQTDQSKFVQADRWFNVHFFNYIAEASGESAAGYKKASELDWTDDTQKGLQKLLKTIWKPPTNQN